MSDELLRDLIDGERAALVPNVGAQKATWAKIAHSVAVDAAPPADPASVAAPLGAARAMAPWTKGLLVLALGGTAIGVATYASRASAPHEPATRQTSTVASVAADHPRVTPDEVRSDALAPSDARPALPNVDPDLTVDAVPEESDDAVQAERTVESTEAAAPPEPRPETPMRAPRPAPPPPTNDSPPAEPAASPSVGSSDLAAEARLLAAARRAIRSDDFTAALRALTEHARRFPDGQLAEDRMTLQATAHCGSGDRQAGRSAADALRNAFPGSPHLARVGRACDEPAPQ